MVEPRPPSEPWPTLQVCWRCGAWYQPKELHVCPRALVRCGLCQTDYEPGTPHVCPMRGTGMTPAAGIVVPTTVSRTTRVRRRR